MAARRQMVHIGVDRVTLATALGASSYHGMPGLVYLFFFIFFLRCQQALPIQIRIINDVGRFTITRLTIVRSSFE